MENVRADLAAPRNIRLLAANLSQLLHLLFDLPLVELRTKHLHRFLAVLDLRALLLTAHHDARRNVRNPHSRVRGVNVLTAGAARAVRIDLEILGADLAYVGVVFDLWHNVTRCERGVTTARGVERRDADEPVHAFLRLQVAVGIEACDLQRDTLHAGFVAGQIVEYLDFVAPLLRPAAVHPQQHLRPVLRLGAAGAWMQLENGIQPVIRLIEEQAELERLELLDKSCDAYLNVFDEASIALFLFQFDHDLQVIEGVREALELINDTFDGVELRDGLLGTFIIVPEVRRSHFFLKVPDRF
ncbi:hypothetical protein D3C71_1443650 [compost metagenome]